MSYRVWALLVLVILTVCTTLYFEHIDDVAKYWWVSAVFIVVSLVLYRFGNRAFDKADQYTRGQKGEGAIWYALRRLPHEYHVFQDVRLPGQQWNIDFVVVGPSGVWTIEVKSHRGVIGLNHGILTRNNQYFEKDVLRQTRGEAAGLGQYLREQMRRQVFVLPVVVFAYRVKIGFGQRPVDGVYVIGRRWLGEVITNRPARLSQGQVEGIVAVVADLGRKK